VIDERRGYQRLALSQPLDGWFGDYAIQLVDVSATGAMIEYDEDIPLDARALLRFYWRGEEVEITSEITRQGDGKFGLHFLEASPELNKLIALSARELLAAQTANAEGDREANRFGEATLTAASVRPGKSSGRYVSCTFEGSNYKCRPSLLPDQPSEGFTVNADLGETQIELLCRTFATGNPEAQRLTRLLAELSVAPAG
jgi:hypothetical protein